MEEGAWYQGARMYGRTRTHQQEERLIQEDKKVSRNA